MKNRLFWQIVGVGVVAALFSMDHGLCKNGRMSSLSFASVACADDSSPKADPTDESKKMPELVFKPLNSAYPIRRAKVPGGWLLIYSAGSITGSGTGAGITYYPDPRHEWDGGSLPDQPEIKALRNAGERMPPRIYGPRFKPASQSAKAIELYDANKDGKISGDELDKAPGLKAALKVMRTDAEKGVTAEQISERIQKWLDSKIGRTSLSCRVLHNGQPLEGATVKFVPEKFLSDALSDTATGTTNQTGMAMLSMPNKPGEDMPPGLPPGMYRVEITKEGENIPAKYNTETTLGQEVSLDNIDLQMGIKFNLKY